MRDVSTTEVITINSQTALGKIGISTGGTIWGFSEWPWSDIAAFLTCIFVLMQIGILVHKYVRAFQAWRAGTPIKVEVE